jgi:hypothetical protein
MPRRKDLGVIDVNRGVIAYVLRQLKTQVENYLIHDLEPSANLKALSIRVRLISMTKFILGGENVNTQKK